MSWELNSNGEAALGPEGWLEQAIRVVREVVGAHKRRGMKVDTAFEQASLDLGISERRTKSLYYRELRAIPREEYLSIAEKFLAHLEAEEKLLEQRSRELRQRRDQYRLELGGKWPESCFSMFAEYGRSFPTLGKNGRFSSISRSGARTRR